MSTEATGPTDADPWYRVHPPSRGTRAEIARPAPAEQELLLRLSDDGRHGYPRRLALVEVPVVVSGAEARLDVGHGALLHHHRNKLTEAPYLLRAPLPPLPAAAQTVWLALMLFNQEPADTTLSPAEITDRAWRSIVDAFEKRPHLQDWLRSRVSPPERHQPPPAAPAPSPPRRHSGSPAQPEGPARPFAFSMVSCQYPHDVLDRTPLHRPLAAREVGPADIALQRMALRLADAGLPEVQLRLELGDQVYVDATAGLFDPTVLRARFERAYALRNEGYGALAMQQAPTVDVKRLFDDHEIADNWHPGDDDLVRPGGGAELLRRAREHWQREQGSHDGPVAHSAVIGGHDFFFGETRLGRSRRSADTLFDADTQIIDQAQWTALEHWLRETKASAEKGRPRFIATPAIVLPRPKRVARDPGAALEVDSWAGYPASLHRLLHLLWRERHAGVVFLSGDEHLAALATITLDDGQPGSRPLRCASIHSPPLYAPYPFANGRAHEFASQECFAVPHAACTAPGGPPFVAGTLRCKVHTWFPRIGDGFAVVDVRQGVLCVGFHAAATGSVRTRTHRL